MDDTPLPTGGFDTLSDKVSGSVNNRNIDPVSQETTKSPGDPCNPMQKTVDYTTVDSVFEMVIPGTNKDLISGMEGMTSKREDDQRNNGMS